MSKEETLEDFLDEDPEIPGQRYALVSFLSPERILEDKTQYMFRRFISEYDLQWKTVKFEAWLAGQIADMNTNLDTIVGKLKEKELKEEAAFIDSNRFQTHTIIEKFQDFCRKERAELERTKLADEFDDFMFKNGDKLEDEFHAKNNFRTTMRGVKIRGVYATEAEAAARARRLAKTDRNFNIYGAQVGKWTPWDPDPNKIQNQEYAEEQLNTLMKKYQENQEQKDQYYQEQKARRIGKAKRATVPDASGNVSEPAPIEITQGNVGRLGDTPGASAVEDSAGVSSYGGMFTGPADLAIQRKMEKAEAENATVEESKE